MRHPDMTCTTPTTSAHSRPAVGTLSVPTPRGSPMRTVHARCGKTWGGDRPRHCGGCCHTFSGLETFDAHRHHRGEHGGCRDPETVLGADGTRRLFFRDGLWRGPEMTAAAKARVIKR